jgi:hypothetical protein
MTLLFKRAKYLYVYSIRLWIMSASSESSISPSTRTIYRMIVANNVAHCHAQLGEEQRSEQSLQYLLRNIAFVLHGQQSNNEDTTMSSSSSVSQQEPAVPRTSIRVLAEHLFPNVMHLLLGGISRKGGGRVAPAA